MTTNHFENLMKTATLLFASLMALSLHAAQAQEPSSTPAPGGEGKSGPNGIASGKPMPDAMPCTGNGREAARGKTTTPGSPGSQSGKPPAAGAPPCVDTRNPPHPGKTTGPGSTGSQSGLNPAAGEKVPANKTLLKDSDHGSKPPSSDGSPAVPPTETLKKETDPAGSAPASP